MIQHRRGVVSRAPEGVPTDAQVVMTHAKVHVLERVQQRVRLGVVKRVEIPVHPAPDVIMNVQGVRIHAHHAQENVLEIAVDVLVVDRYVPVIALMYAIAVYATATYSVVRTALVVAMEWQLTSLQTDG